MILNPLLSRPVVYCILFVCLSVSSFRKYISSSSLSLLLYLSLSVCLSLLSIRFFLSHCQSLPLIFFASSSCIPISSRYLFVSSCHRICLSLSSVCFFLLYSTSKSVFSCRRPFSSICLSASTSSVLCLLFADFRATFSSCHHYMLTSC